MSLINPLMPVPHKLTHGIYCIAMYFVVTMFSLHAAAAAAAANSSSSLQSLNIIVKPSLRLVAAFFSAVMVSK